MSVRLGKRMPDDVYTGLVAATPEARRFVSNETHPEIFAFVTYSSLEKA